MLPKVGGLPSLRTLLVDEPHVQNSEVQAACMARTGHEGVHACKVHGYVKPRVATPEAPMLLSPRSPPRVMGSPRFAVQQIPP